MDNKKLEQMYNEVVDYNTKLENELETYKLKSIPKYDIKQKLYCLDQNKNIVTLTVDEIVISKLGIFYREYKSENDFIQFPENLCSEFNNK